MASWESFTLTVENEIERLVVLTRVWTFAEACADALCVGLLGAGLLKAAAGVT